MVNKVILVGRLCTDPELKYTPSGVAVANFRIAVDRPFANAQGERETDFIDIVTWRQNAEFVNTYVSKGRLVLVEGRIQVRQWQTQEGQRRRTTEVVADSVRSLERPKDAGDGSGANRANYSRRDEPPMPEPEPEMAPDFDIPDIIDPFADQ